MTIGKIVERLNGQKQHVTHEGKPNKRDIPRLDCRYLNRTPRSPPATPAAGSLWAAPTAGAPVLGLVGLPAPEHLRYEAKPVPGSGRQPLRGFGHEKIQLLGAVMGELVLTSGKCAGTSPGYPKTESWVSFF